MGFRNPEIFGYVISFSPTWKGTLSGPFQSGKAVPHYYLLVGRLEFSKTQNLVKEWAQQIGKYDKKI